MWPEGLLFLRLLVRIRLQAILCVMVIWTYPDDGAARAQAPGCQRSSCGLGLCNYVELIDPTFRDAGGVD